MTTDEVETQIPRTAEFPDEDGDPLPIPEPTGFVLVIEIKQVTLESQITMSPTLESPLLVSLLPIPEPYEVFTRDSTVESEMVISPTLEPRDPYPLPIPELLAPVVVTVEFAIVIIPAFEPPVVQNPLPRPAPYEELCAVTFESDTVMSPVAELPSFTT
jgi:hypothetical protein